MSFFIRKEAESALEQAHFAPGWLEGSGDDESSSEADVGVSIVSSSTTASTTKPTVPRKTARRKDTVEDKKHEETTAQLQPLPKRRRWKRRVVERFTMEDVENSFMPTNWELSERISGLTDAAYAALKSIELNKQLIEKANAIGTLVEEGDKSEEEDPTIIIKVHSEIGTRPYKMFKISPMKQIISTVAKQCRTSEFNLTLKVDGIPVSPTDTPMSLGLSPNQVLEAVVNVPASSEEPTEATQALTQSTQKEQDIVRVKVQLEDTIIKYGLPKTAQFAKLFSAFSQAVKKPLGTLQFHYDGRALAPNSTPNDVDFEDNSIVDAKAK
ncbi:hypothetical protein Pelo_2544 [Pelomyxa schiedti]|nr:hypothetical protein Pelo_2544 [Pelomyxa schiedti]